MPTLDVNGITINYRDDGRGEGPPIVFLHAFPFDSSMWEPQITALRDRHRCIAPDLSGFGGSAVPDDAGSYSMDAWAGEVEALLDHLALDRVVLLGLSMGGYLTFAYLRQHRDRVAALILADTRAEADSEEARERRTTQQALVRSEGTAGLINALRDALLSEKTRANKPDVYERMTTLMDNPAAGFIGALEAMKTRPDSSSELASIDVPTLVIVGESDAVTPPEAARTIHEHVGGSRLVVIPEAGHISNFEAPDAFNGAVAEFLG